MPSRLPFADLKQTSLTYRGIIKEVKGGRSVMSVRTDVILLLLRCRLHTGSESDFPREKMAYADNKAREQDNTCPDRQIDPVGRGESSHCAQGAEKRTEYQ